VNSAQPGAPIWVRDADEGLLRRSGVDREAAGRERALRGWV